MSAEVDWVLAQLQSVVDAQPVDHPLTRVNRDDSKLLEGDIRSKEGELQDSNFVGATLADRSSEPLGTEFDNRVEAVVGVRVVGLHHDKFGHVDPDGLDGVVFDALVDDVREAIEAERSFPSVGREDTSYHTLFIENDAPQSSDWRDFYRYDFDVRFAGYRTLPTI